MKDLQKKSFKDLQTLIREKREGLREFRFGNTGAKTRNVREGRNMRKDIARAFTAARAKEATK